MEHGDNDWYDLDGIGRAIVFLHAALGDRRMWHPQWDRFRSTNTVARFDLAGFGNHAVPITSFSRTAQVQDVLREHQIDDAIVVGASMGGRVALELAIDSPELVGGLVLLCSAVPGHEWGQQVRDFWSVEEAALEANDLDRAVEANLEFWLDGHEGKRSTLSEPDRALVSAMQRQAFENHLSTPSAAPEEFLVPDIAQRVSEIDVPATVAYGTKDVTDIEAIARRLANELPQAQLTAVDDTAHLPSLERPEIVNDLIANHLLTR